MPSLREEDFTLVNATDALAAIQSFAAGLDVSWKSGRSTSWAKYLAGNPKGNVDEDQLVQPRVFPAFASQVLGFEVGVTLNAEQQAHLSRPDFTPLDLTTHRFVFEVKGTSDSLATHDTQVGNYLRRPGGRIRAVALTNMALIRVARLDHDQIVWDAPINLRALIAAGAAGIQLPDVDRLAKFIAEFSRVILTTDEKLQRIREAPPWDPELEPSDPGWLTARIGVAVERISTDVAEQTASLVDPRRTTGVQRDAVLANLRQLAVRLDVDNPDGLSLAAFLAADAKSPVGKTRLQFEAHVAYQYVARMVLSRVWEDLGIVSPANLYDGEFAKRMDALNGILPVLNHAFNAAGVHYRPLFADNPTHSWYLPSESAAIDALYELASAYFGHITSDILGAVYERMLERIDRKLLGQYYTPRDVIALMWSLVLDDGDMMRRVTEDARLPVVLDIAAGSGGFLVEGAKRFREFFNELTAQGGLLNAHDWVDQTATALNGVEFQPFSAYLAEINLLIQLSVYLQDGSQVALPELGVIHGDTLSLHNPMELLPAASTAVSPSSGVSSGRADRLRDPFADDGLAVDIAIGNPPYIGEKIGSAVMRRTRAEFPYWEQFVAPHLDYLYWFLILGVSKLRVGGRFAFITTDYWLRANGASKLRGFLAERCHVERVILFRDMRLFPDAPGQHNMIVVGTRAGGGDAGPLDRNAFPVVSIYQGPNVSMADRAPVLAALAGGRSSARLAVRSHRALVSPNVLGSASWADLELTRVELGVRDAHRARPSLPEISVEEGVIPTVQQLKASAAAHLPAAVAVAGRGVQLLSPDEVAGLGVLSAAERAVLRKRVNTADVFPYAAVVAADADSMIYLPRPKGDPAAVFPAGMPALEAHLSQFRPLMQHTVDVWKDKRPWWSLHRAREGTILRAPVSDVWEDYGIASRWGSGGRLVMGLAPAGSVPASGLHLISCDARPGLAPYLAAMVNSTPIQELAAKLPPGHLRSAEMAALHIPDLGPDAVAGVSGWGVRLAEIVTLLVSVHAARFPMIPAALRSDVAMSADPLWRWTPAPSAVSATLSSRDWVHSVSVSGKAKSPVATVDVSSHPGQLEATIVLSNGSVKSPGSAVLSVSSSASAGEVEALAALAAGAGSLDAVAGLRVPLTFEQLASAFERDRRPVLDLLDEYRLLRSQVDALLR